MAKLPENLHMLREMVGFELTAVRALGGLTFLVFDSVTDQMFCLEDSKFWDYDEVADQVKRKHEIVRASIAFRREMRIEAVARAIEKANASKRKYV